MLSSNIKAVIKIFLLMSLPGVYACGKGDEGKSWNFFTEAIEQERAQHSRRPSVAGLIELFSKKNKLMIDIVAACESNPAIRRVGVKDGAVSFYDQAYSYSDFKPVIDAIRLALLELSASSVECGRRGDFEGNPLSVVSFVMYSSGLSVSGSLMGILYRTEWSKNNNPITSDQIESRGYIELSKEGWYVYKD